MFSACVSHAAAAAATTTPALLLFKEHFGIEGGSTSGCCDTYEYRPCDYSEQYRSHGNISSYEGHCVNATKAGPWNCERGPHPRSAIGRTILPSIRSLLLALDMRISASLPISAQILHLGVVSPMLASVGGRV